MNWLEQRGIPYAPEVRAGYGKDEPMDEATIIALAALMTNVDRPVYALTDAMPMEVSTAAFARYSRSSRPMRTLLAREFWGKNGLDVEKARELAGRVAMEFGDDSVKQLGVVRMACEMVSQLAVKELEDGRLGGWLEKSSRYVDFGTLVNGKFLYLRPREIREAGSMEKYEEIMDEAFELYKASAKVMREFLVKKFPMKNGVDEQVYKASIRAKAFDIVRVFLPMATLTNAGMILSGQAVENMLNKMAVSPLEECRTLASEIRAEVSQVLPSLVASEENDKHGVKARDYLLESRKKTGEAAARLLSRIPERLVKEEGMKVELVERDPEALNKVVAAILFEHSKSDLADIKVLVDGLTEAEKQEVVEDYLAGRTDRRHKPGRAFEKAVYGLQVTAKVAEWRDLQRQRMMTQQRQLITMDHGFFVPPEFDEIEVDGVKVTYLYRAHMEKRREVFEQVRDKVSPEAAQYMAAFGNFMKWIITANLRQLYHMIPLRAGAAGHPDYRRVVREMFYEMLPHDPILVLPMERFIDFSDEPRLDRLEQLEKVKQKLDWIGAKGDDTFEAEW
ncbi:MAG: thymidylate synthase complementing protein ThyX [Microgenomates group bacterium Gr01-1014_16]|nr:MAG: thymidylate synthase complementing protein ThyX [Microgenomates group bacterium Gr01-1014_16]